jgi:hypothetical protein
MASFFGSLNNRLFSCGSFFCGSLNRIAFLIMAPFLGRAYPLKYTALVISLYLFVGAQFRHSDKKRFSLMYHTVYGKNGKNTDGKTRLFIYGVILHPIC